MSDYGLSEYRDKKVKRICRFDNILWGDFDTNKIYATVYEHELKSTFDTTPFFDFEIYLMANGFELYMGQLGANGGRSYRKDRYLLYIEYGAKVSTDWGQTLVEYFKWAVCDAGDQIRHMPTKFEDYEEFLKTRYGVYDYENKRLVA